MRLPRIRHPRMQFSVRWMCLCILIPIVFVEVDSILLLRLSEMRRERSPPPGQSTESFGCIGRGHKPLLHVYSMLARRPALSDHITCHNPIAKLSEVSIDR